MRGICRLACLFAACLLASLTADAIGADAVAKGQDIAPDESRFAAVTDGTESIGPEEMPAYWNLLRSVQHTPFAKLSTQRLGSDQFHSLCNEPSRHRGASSEIALAVRRVLAYQVPTSDAGADRLYEVWGWDEENPDQLIVAVVPQLPSDCPIGEQVAYRAIFRGQFFKLQGYTVASLQPGDRFRSAPLFVGRMIARPEIVTPLVTQADIWSLGAGGLFIASLTTACCYGWRRGSTTKKLSNSVQLTSPAWDEWLQSSHAAGP